MFYKKVGGIEKMFYKKCDRCGKFYEIDLDSSDKIINGHSLEYGSVKQEVCEECWNLLQKFISTKGNLDLLLILIGEKIGVEPYYTFHIKEEGHNLLYRFDDTLTLQYRNSKLNWITAGGYTLMDFLTGRCTLDIVDRAD